MSSRLKTLCGYYYATLLVLLICTSALAASKSVAQYPPAEPLKPSFRAYTDRDGLPQRSATAMAFDKKGYLWVGTQDGAAYYNGRKWTVVNMPNKDGNYIRAILSCADGRLFFATINGLYCLHNERWQTYNKQSGALPGDSVFSLLETIGEDGRSHVWVGSDEGLARLTGDQWTILTTNNSPLPSNSINSLLETETGPERTLWVATNNGLAKLVNNQWTTLNSKNSSLPNDNIQSLLASYADNGLLTLWIGTLGGGVARLEHGQWSVFNSKNSPLPNDNVQSLAETVTKSGQRKIWMGSLGGGLAAYKDGQWAVFTITNSSLPDNNITKLMAGRLVKGETTLWIGSLTNGLIRLKDDKWALFDTRDARLPFNFALGMMETTSPEGRPVYWIGSDGGLIKYDGGRWSTFSTRNSPLKHDGVNCMLEMTSARGQREVWLGTFGGGLVRIVNDQWTVFTTKDSLLPEDKVQVLMVTRSAESSPILWVGTFGGGLVKIAGDRWQVFNTKNSQITNNYIFGLAETREPDGRSIIWVGTYGNGLVKIDGDQWTNFHTQNSQLPNNVVISMTAMTGAAGDRFLWVGTASAGACRINLSRPTERWQIINDTTRPALANNIVNQIREDSQHRIYFFTNKGIACLIPNPTQPDNLAAATLYNFTTEDGLPSNECDSNGSMIDSRGRIWAGMVGGVAVFDANEFMPDQIGKPIALEQTLVNGKDIALAARSDLMKPLTGLSLSYRENNLSFEYALLSYYKESETRFRTQLIGYDETPSDWSPYNKQNYTNLQAGEYRFVIWARDYAGNVTSQEMISFHINSAPWRTWWAYLAYLLFGATVIYGGLQLRLRSLQERNRMLEARINERTAIISAQKEDLARKNEELVDSERRALEANHAKSIFLANVNHEMRTPLNAILGFVQLMEREAGRSAPDKEKLTIIMESGEHLLDLINNVLSITKIEAGQITLTRHPFNPMRMLEGLEEMFKARAQAKRLRFEICCQTRLPDFVDGDIGRLRQVLINLLSNAFKFTERGQVALTVRYQHDRAYFEVQDSGPGIDKSELHKLFQPFVQTETGLKAKEGTGLGLAISRHLISLMGGDIKVESAVGSGTSFSFEIDLPVADIIAEQKQERKVMAVAPGQPEYRLVVADDVSENRKFLAELLTQSGFSVKQVANGAEAVEIWQQWQPHLIWMDMRMPLMDGHEATRLIRSKEREQPRAQGRTVIIALTASSFEHDRSAILANGCDDFVAKPFKVGTIFAQLSEKLNVKFVYEESETVVAARAGAPAQLTAGDLLSLPADLRADLSSAIISGNVDVARQVTERIRQVDDRIAQGLESMIKNYQFGEIFTLMERPP